MKPLLLAALTQMPSGAESELWLCLSRGEFKAGVALADSLLHEEPDNRFAGAMKVRLLAAWGKTDAAFREGVKYGKRAGEPEAFNEAGGILALYEPGLRLKLLAQGRKHFGKDYLFARSFFGEYKANQEWEKATEELLNGFLDGENESWLASELRFLIAVQQGGGEEVLMRWLKKHPGSETLFTVAAEHLASVRDYGFLVWYGRSLSDGAVSALSVAEQALADGFTEEALALAEIVPAEERGVDWAVLTARALTAQRRPKEALARLEPYVKGSEHARQLALELALGPLKDPALAASLSRGGEGSVRTAILAGELETALALCDETISYDCGRALLYAGEFAEAAATFRLFVSRNPASPDAPEALFYLEMLTFGSDEELEPLSRVLFALEQGDWESVLSAEGEGRLASYFRYVRGGALLQTGRVKEAYDVFLGLAEAGGYLGALACYRAFLAARGELRDESLARKALEILVRRYPGTAYAEVARSELN